MTPLRMLYSLTLKYIFKLKNQNISIGKAAIANAKLYNGDIYRFPFAIEWNLRILFSVNLTKIFNVRNVNG